MDSYVDPEPGLGSADRRCELLSLWSRPEARQRVQYLVDMITTVSWSQQTRPEL